MAASTTSSGSNSRVRRHVVAHPDRARQALEFSARTQPGKGLADYAARGIGRRG
ncbi:hypothetical protein [Nocardia sp. NPDC004722]